MRLLVHTAGEADLLLDSQRNRDQHIRGEQMETRRRQLAAALAQPDGLDAVRGLLDKGAWSDEYPSTAGPSPLLAILSTVEQTPDLCVLILGTSQQSPHPLDTMRVAQTLADLLTAGTSSPVRTAGVVCVPGMSEAEVVPALTQRLNELPRYEQTLVTWGSGAMALTMGALTALSRAGLGWQLVTVNGPTPDPLDGLDTDPVIGVLVRWRMFASLEHLATTNPPLIRLTDTQHDLIRQAAARHRAGFAADDCATLRAVLADAVVRRDGTASLAVRRYITRRYEELLAADQVTHPHAENLIVSAERQLRKAGRIPTLGRVLGWIDRNSNPAVQHLSSYDWLHTRVVEALQNIGKGSHTLRPPDPADVKKVGEYLSPYTVDETGWHDAGLPDPPTSPAFTVLAVWLAGNRPSPPAGTVGQQLIRRLPAVVMDHLGSDEATFQAVIFGVPGDAGSLGHATEDAQRVIDAGREAWTASIDVADVEHVIERRLNPETAALLYVPTGRQMEFPTLLRAMRRVSARHGLPLFVRQTAEPRSGHDYTDVYLWPALIGGDLALLVAAREAIQALELDVAWRLLAASGINADVTENARRLAATFASRQPEHDPATVAEPMGTIDLITQRLALVRAALAEARTPADRTRLLVIAADTLEASIAATQPPGQRPGTRYAQFRTSLGVEARRGNAPGGQSARILLLLNEARDGASITHGTESDPDAVVAQAASALAQKWSSDAAELPRDVAALVSSAVTAAEARGLGGLDRSDELLGLQQRIFADIGLAIIQRSTRPRLT